MKNITIESLFKQINNPDISTLSDIAKLSYSTFLKRVDNKLPTKLCHYLYQHAIHSLDEGEYYATVLRYNPQIKNLTVLSLNSTLSKK
ncbi:hypothetical protein AB4427_06250 [Vibrio artabrorum]|uniref:hypothetical protein n=1 Tax=Vibrio artabrorum TaxID=446374 RepID=UPI00355115D3